MNAPARLMCVAALALGCQSSAPGDDAAPPPEPRASLDRLTADERLPEAETAFGLPIPTGMRVTRQFSDAAYISGELDMAEALAHIQKHVQASGVEMMSRRAVFARARIKGQDEGRLFRIEVAKVPRGSQVHVKEITPPPSARGLSEAERWSRAGRKPDGTLLDPNQVY